MTQQRRKWGMGGRNKKIKLKVAALCNALIPEEDREKRPAWEEAGRRVFTTVTRCPFQAHQSATLSRPHARAIKCTPATCWRTQHPSTIAACGCSPGIRVCVEKTDGGQHKYLYKKSIFGFSCIWGNALACCSPRDVYNCSSSWLWAVEQTINAWVVKAIETGAALMMALGAGYYASS